MLNNRDISDKYTITLRNKYDELQKISGALTLNEEFEIFVNADMEAPAECIPTTQQEEIGSVGDFRSQEKP